MMKKTPLKVLGTLLTIVVFIVAQYHIRRYYNIDPRIWFFVVLGISFVGFCVVCGIFYSEIESMEEYFKTHSFFDFVSNISKKVNPISQKIKLVTESFLYVIIDLLITLVAFTGVMYKFFFHDDFMTRKTVYIIFLVAIACKLLSQIIIAIFNEKKEKEIVLVGLWLSIFLMHFLEFVFI